MPSDRFTTLVDTPRHDFWRYARLLPEVPREWQIENGQTEWTPLQPVGEWQLKREDTSVTGSHKLRGLTYQLARLSAGGQKFAVLGSSGNAAIAASRLAAVAGIHVFLLLDPTTNLNKLAALDHANITAILTSRALSALKVLRAKFDLPDLRPSQDENAALGFCTLGWELFEQTAGSGGVDNIFSFVTSGASVRGIAAAWTRLRELGATGTQPKIFGVYSMGELAGQLAGGGVDKLATTREVCEMSGGQLVEVSDTEIVAGREKLQSFDATTSAEGCGAWAAAEKIAPRGKTIVVATGRVWPEATPDLAKFHRTDSLDEIAKIVAQKMQNAQS